MHRLHLASRWDCPPVYCQGTCLPCDAKLHLGLRLCLLYPQEQQTRGFRREPPFPRSLSTRSLPPQSQAALPDHKLLLCLLPPPHAIYPLVLAPHTRSFGLTLHFVTTSVSTDRRALIPSLHLPAKGPLRTASRTLPSTALESSNARATCQSLPQSYQIITPPLQSHLEGQEAPPTTPFCPPASSTVLGLALLQLGALSVADIHPHAITSFLRIPTSSRSRSSIVFLRLSGRTPCFYGKQHHNLLLIYTANHGSSQS